MIIPVLLCGGTGSRLWPLSRPSYPKQYLIIPGAKNNLSLYQQGIHRLASIEGCNVEAMIIAANEEHRFLAVDQLSKFNDIDVTVLLEPSAKNTAPALTMAAMYASDRHKDIDPVLVVSPADHLIDDNDAFSSAISGAIKLAQEDKFIVLGIKANSPNTGYGYIKVRGDSSGSDLGGKEVQSFVEKPSLEVANSFLNSGNYFWNSGIFVMKSSLWLSALRRYRPDIFNATQAAFGARHEDSLSGFALLRPGKNEFKKIESESIDYAVLEKCDDKNFPIQMIELKSGWSDLGSWDAVSQACEKDSSGNASYGDVLSHDCKNSFVYSNHRLEATVGLDNIIVVETPDAILVADKKYSQGVKNVVYQLDSSNREEISNHRKVLRPWGCYDVLDQGEFFKVKRIQVNPGASLSLQSHEHRAEHWVVVRGIAKIINGNSEKILKENQSTYIPRGNLHRLINAGSEVLEVIEVQSGEYLGEDDITRFEDFYGRD